MSNEFSTPKLTPADDVKIPAVDGSNDTGYLLGEEVSQYIGSPLSGETDEYSTLESYSVGDTVIYENALYECTTATSGVFDPSDWKKITLKQLMTDLNSALSSITSLSTNKLSISDLASSLGQETNTAPTNKAVDDAITSLSSTWTKSDTKSITANSNNDYDWNCNVPLGNYLILANSRSGTSGNVLMNLQLGADGMSGMFTQAKTTMDSGGGLSTWAIATATSTTNKIRVSIYGYAAYTAEIKIAIIRLGELTEAST